MEPIIALAELATTGLGLIAALLSALAAVLALLSEASRPRERKGRRR